MKSKERLIYANDLKQRFEERAEADVEMFGVYIPECFPADDANEIVDSMPTVDAVEVVRCKDCMDCEMCYPEKQLDREATQAWLCKRYKMYRRPDDFCSRGKRKDGAT